MTNQPRFCSTHPKASAYPSAKIIKDAIAKVPEQTRMQAYISNLGFIKSLMKLYRVDATTVVDIGNRFGKSIGFDKPPALEQRLVSKMGLKGVPGLAIEGKGPVVGSAPAGPAQGRRSHRPAGSGSNNTPLGTRNGRPQGVHAASQTRGAPTRGAPTRAGATGSNKAEGDTNGAQSGEPRRKRARR